MRTFRVTALAIAIMFVAPASLAIGCSIVAKPPSRPHIAAGDLRFLHHHRGTQGAWVRGEGWISSRLGLQDSIQPRFARRPITAAFAQQRALNLVAIRPIDGVYSDDEDPATTCAIAGRRVYSATRLLVRETDRAVFLNLASHITPGSTEGCRIQSTSCDDLVQRTVRLQAPIGDRKLYAVTFASS